MPRLPTVLQLGFASLISAAISGPIFLFLVLLWSSLSKPPGLTEPLTAVPMLFMISGVAAFEAAKLAVVPAFLAGSLLWFARHRAWAQSRIAFLIGGALVGAAMPLVAAMLQPGLAGLLRDPSLGVLALPLAGGLSGLIFRALMDSSAPFFGTDEPALGD